MRNSIDPAIRGAAHPYSRADKWQALFYIKTCSSLRFDLSADRPQTALENCSAQADRQLDELGFGEPHELQGTASENGISPSDLLELLEQPDNVRRCRRRAASSLQMQKTGGEEQAAVRVEVARDARLAEQIDSKASRNDGVACRRRVEKHFKTIGRRQAKGQGISTGNWEGVTVFVCHAAWTSRPSITQYPGRESRRPTTDTGYRRIAAPNQYGTNAPMKVPGRQATDAGFTRLVVQSTSIPWRT